MAEAQLHELLAVEQDLKGQAGKILLETQTLFGKPEAFKGSITHFEPFDENQKHLATEDHEELATTVEDRLNYTAESLAKYWDAVAQKEATNQAAKADIIVDGRTLATNVPATMLLGLETKLTQFRAAIAGMPTLDAKAAWQPASHVRRGVYETVHTQKTFRTDKRVKPVVLYEATKEHAAQVKEVSEDVKIGVVTKKHFSGAVSSARASEILSNVDKLLRAVKAARQRANKQPIVSVNIGKTLLDFALATPTPQS